MSVAASFTPFQVMCSGTMIQGISINDIPLHTVGRIEQVWEDVLGSPELYGDPIHVPLRPGALHIPQVTGPREFSVGMVLYGSGDKDQAGHNSVWRDLARTLWSPMAPLTMTRTLRFTEGDETHTCSAQFVSGLNPEMIVPGSMSRVSLRFMNLDGYWYTTDTLTASVTTGSGGSITVPGDAQTRRMTLTFQGGGALQTLTNTTNNCILSVTADSTTPIDLDVFAFTADRDGENVVGAVNHAGDVFWMRLECGLNEFTLTGGGSVTISALGAYL